MKDFVSPTSMLTPGFAGTMTMVISNTIAKQFQLIEPWPAAVGLSVSALFGLLIIAQTTIPFWQRLIYYVLNSLIIFTVAVGSATLGEAAASAGTARHALAAPAVGIVSVLVPAAHAQAAAAPDGWCCLNQRVNPSPREECTKWGGRIFPTQEEAERACASPATPPRSQSDEGFFRPWLKTR